MSLPVPRRSGTWGFVREPISPGDETRLRAAYQPGWRAAILDAMAWYQSHPQPGSVVDPKWVPVSWLVEVCDGLDVDGLVATLVRLERDGVIVQRAMRLGGIDHPVATLDTVRHPPTGGRVALPDGRNAELGATPRKALGP